jgi:hypothetical protein
MMNRKLLLSTILGASAWSLSSVASANWDTGACPQPHSGPAPCIETEINGSTYHFNGSGGHADVWHGVPAAEGGGDFQFSSSDVDVTCTTSNPSCAFSSRGEIKKCQDSDGAWRIGVRVNSADVSPGQFLCNFITIDGFPWYSKDPTITTHCPFEDDCDNFLPYDPGASIYTANFGNVTVSASLVGTLINAEHLHGAVFTPGPGATLAFSSSFYNCDDEEQDCSINGVLTLDNVTSLEIY